MEYVRCANPSCEVWFDYVGNRLGWRHYCSTRCGNQSYAQNSRTRKRLATGKSRRTKRKDEVRESGFVYDGTTPMLRADYMRKLRRCTKAWSDGVEWDDLVERFGASMSNRVATESGISEYQRMKAAGFGGARAYRVTFAEAWKTPPKTSTIQELYRSFYTGS